MRQLKHKQLLKLSRIRLSHLKQPQLTAEFAGVVRRSRQGSRLSVAEVATQAITTQNAVEEALAAPAQAAEAAAAAEEQLANIEAAIAGIDADDPANEAILLRANESLEFAQATVDARAATAEQLADTDAYAAALMNRPLQQPIMLLQQQRQQKKQHKQLLTLLTYL